MTLPHDSAGFLRGKPTDGPETDAERAADELEVIRGHTDELVSLARQQQRTSRSFATHMQQSRLPTVEPRTRGAVPAREAAPSTRHAAVAADAAASMARTVAAQARNARADRASQPRGADGRFGGAGPAGLPALARAAGGRAAGLMGNASAVDPLFAAMGEARAAGSAVRAVATPLGRGFSGLTGGPAGTNDVQAPTSWLRKLWRELRGMRKDDAKGARDMLRELREARMSGSGPAGTSGRGLLASLAGLAPTLAGVAALLGRLPAVLGLGMPGPGTAAPGGVKGLLRRLPLIGSAFEIGAGALEDRRIAGDATLTDAERRRQRAANAGGVGGALAGAGAGAMAGGLVLGPVGAVGGAVLGGLAGSELGQRAGGWVSQMFESGKGGAGTISTGKGDFGGKSYGTHQLSSKTGTLQDFLASSGYGAQFTGLAPGSAEFDAKWKSIAASDKGFGASQHDFIKRTHADKMISNLQRQGLDLSGRGEAVQEALFSTATQFGPGSSLVKKALAGKDVAALSDADIVASIQDYKIANNDSLFKSSSANVRAGTLDRAAREKATLLAVAGAPGVPTPPTLASVAARPPAMAAGAPPVVEMPLPTSMSSGKPAAPPAQPTQVASQDVRDRTIAHIVTGGIGGSIAHR